VTRLVVHAGTHATGWLDIQRQLVSWRPALQQVGVWLHPLDDHAAWAADAAELAESAAPESVVTAATSAIAAGATMLLLSAERLEDAMRDRAQVANIETFARDYGMRLTVEVVIRDQPGYLNALYCDRVTHLQSARDFSSFIIDPQPEERFDYQTAFDAVLGVPDIEFVAVPYASLPEGAPARALLEAVGVPGSDLEGLPAAESRPDLPGPFAIAASRLLFKRMWRMGMFKNLPRPLLLDAATELRRHAEEQEWDEGPFWGWTERARKAAIKRYRAGNDAFAKAAWGRPWGDDWENGTHVDVDLAASPPGLVVDLLQSVDRIVTELQQAKLAIAAEAAQT
jgi:hypothetical protein